MSLISIDVASEWVDLCCYHMIDRVGIATRSLQAESVTKSPLVKRKYLEKLVNFSFYLFPKSCNLVIVHFCLPPLHVSYFWENWAFLLLEMDQWDRQNWNAEKKLTGEHVSHFDLWPVEAKLCIQCIFEIIKLDKSLPGTKMKLLNHWS